MCTVSDDGDAADAADAAGVDQGRWLMSQRVRMEGDEAAWLAVLVEFDRSARWADDGHLHCAWWLVHRLKMGRSTAFEKLHIAHALSRRPVVAEAFAAGRISYSAVRVITRLEDPTAEVDAALVRVAEQSSVRHLERAARYYQYLRDQDSPPDDPGCRRGVRLRENFDGSATAEITLTAVELEELRTALEVFLHPQEGPHTAAGDTGGGDVGAVDESARADAAAGDVVVDGASVDESAHADTDAGDAGPGASDVGVDGASVDESARADGGGVREAGEDGAGPVPWHQRRVDAFMEMVRSALGVADHGRAGGADRYLIHAVADVAALEGGRGRGELIHGQPVPPSTLARLACDASTVVHLFDGGEPLNLGRRTRVWNTAQRRAITVRDGGRCRFPACDNRRCDIHHLAAWTAGGETNIANGALLCDRHHSLIHTGFTTTGAADGPLTFHRPDGTPIDTTTPAATPPTLFGATGHTEAA